MDLYYISQIHKTTFRNYLISFVIFVCWSSSIWGPSVVWTRSETFNKVINKQIHSYFSSVKSRLFSSPFFLIFLLTILTTFVSPGSPSIVSLVNYLGRTPPRDWYIEDLESNLRHRQKGVFIFVINSFPFSIPFRVGMKTCVLRFVFEWLKVHSSNNHRLHHGTFRRYPDFVLGVEELQFSREDK